jgi:hypothetical protein
VARTPPERTLDWVLGVIGAGARIVETRTLRVTAAKTRVAATALSFALCFAYLLFLPFHAWGLAALIAVDTLVLISLGQAGDVGVAAITTAAVMVIAALGPRHAWQKPHCRHARRNCNRPRSVLARGRQSRRQPPATAGRARRMTATETTRTARR